MTETIRRVMTPGLWGMLVALSVLWGGSFFFAAVAVQELPPLTVAAVRAGGAALLLNAALPLAGLRLPLGAQLWTAFAVMGVINNVIPFALIFWGQSHIPSGLASILNATTPLSTIIVAHLATSDEKMAGGRLLGVLIGFFGVATMVGPQMLLAGLATDVFAQLAIVLAGFSYACAGVYGRRFARLGVPPMITAAGQVTASGLMLAPIALFYDQPWTLPLPSLPVWGALFGIAALSTALAYVVYFRILAAAGATNLLLVTFLIPVSAVTMGALVLGERLEPRHFVGMALISLGLACIDGRPFRGLSRRLGGFRR
ncbi:MAG: DMT family transporter [Beijerinckiaceae bacterium]|jgi:drug/metabolite transporter (DMT)-like permease|nr:DMT family transporter [Beijerinckiaceae bacterium]MDO9442062.1 DMT family transporter [Beijerinckiaceae bacterium]